MRAPTEWCPNWRTGAIDIRLVTLHGYVHDQEMLLARQVRAADDTRASSAGPPTASDLKRKATEHGVAAIWQDARESLDYSVRTYYTKAGITYLQRTTTLPDGVRVRGRWAPNHVRRKIWRSPCRSSAAHSRTFAALATEAGLSTAAVRAIRPVLRAIRAVSIFGPSDTRNAVLYASCGLRVVAREAGNL